MSDIPTAISRLGESDSREAQTTRAVKWLLEQPGGSIVVVTPRRDFEGASLKRLLSSPGVAHHAWRTRAVTTVGGACCTPGLIVRTSTRFGESKRTPSR